MNHTTEFFRDEVRNGFYIPTAIKQAWACILDVLKEIDDICRRHDIRYFADWGTLLGTVRHGGFIPWDDDLDICMLRDDYVRFRQVADAELPAGFAIHDFERKDDHWLFLSRVVNSKRICFDEEYLDEHYNFPYLACVDIFVMDYLYRDEETEKSRDKQIMELISMAYGLNKGRLSVGKIADDLARIGAKYGFAFSADNEGHRVERELFRLAQALMSEVAPFESDKVGHIFPWILKGGKGWPKSWFEDTVRLPFEDITMPVPRCYNKVLSNKYGNYCEVRKVWNGHDYPFFEGQKRDLEAVNGAPLPEYEFDPGMLRRPVVLPGSEEVVDVSAGSDVSDGTNGSDGISGTDIDEWFTDEILFLPTGPDRWECFASIYEKLRSHGENVCVVPLPVMRKDVMGEITSTDDEIMALTALDRYPKGVEVADWLSYDISAHRPRRIYIQDPYDEKNPYLTIPPSYYAAVLRLYTQQLVFVPFKKTGEFGPKDSTDQYNLKHYLIAPGVIYADVIYAYSENLRQQYINALTAFSGEEYRSVWEKRIVVAEYGNLDEVSAVDSAVDSDHNKKLLYCIGLNEITELGEPLIESVKARLSLIAENADALSVSVAFYPSDFGMWYHISSVEKLWDMVVDVVYEKGFEMVQINPKSADDMAAGYDAYYGSPSPLVPAFIMQKKPVMLADHSLRL